MTALDQAFIKAFARQETTPPALAPRPNAPANEAAKKERTPERKPDREERPPKPAAVKRRDAVAFETPPVLELQKPESTVQRPSAAVRSLNVDGLKSEINALSSLISHTSSTLASAANVKTPAPVAASPDTLEREAAQLKAQLLGRPPLSPLSAHTATATSATPSASSAASPATRLDEVWAALEMTAKLAESSTTAEVEDLTRTLEAEGEPETLDRVALGLEPEKYETQEYEPTVVECTEDEPTPVEETWTEAASLSLSPVPEFASEASAFDDRESEFSASPIVLPVGQHEFKPAWQVDHFTWPKLCRRLIAKATDELDRLADALLALKRQGQTVLAIGGCQQGEGATTMLLCAANRLSERGIKTLLVDADLQAPRLAKCLGVQTQVGWDEATDKQNPQPDQAIVEATGSNLSLLPVREPPEQSGRAPGDPTRLSDCLKTLRDHYDVVLVDLGPIQNAGLAEDRWGWVSAGAIDAVVLVQNRRITSEPEQTALESQLAVAGVAVAGIVENFVADE